VNVFVAAAGIVVFFGVADDLREIGYKIKFGGQILAALIIIVFGGVKLTSLGFFFADEVFLPEWLSIPLTLFIIVGVTNAINLADGLDGLAGGISMLSMLCIAFLAYLADNGPVALLAAGMVGAIFGFLRFNTYPARLFMGDAGSELLGFAAITLSIALTQTSVPLSPALPALLVGLPALDTAMVIYERIREGQLPFRADKRHLHHKFLTMGFYHTEAVFLIYVLHALLVVSAYFLRYHSSLTIILIYLGFSIVVTASYLIVKEKNWHLKREGVLDLSVKKRLAFFKKGNVLLKLSFLLLSMLLPLLLVFSALLPSDMPEYLGWSALIMAVVLVCVWRLKANWMQSLLSVVLYLTIPFLIYLSESLTVPWLNIGLIKSYNLAFGIVAALSVVTLKYTRRRHGFKITPMDFLILFVAVVVPNLPDESIRSYQMGSLAAKIVTLYFGVEVWMGELRGKYDVVLAFTVAILGIIGLRGIMQL
jgi:UDP-GlcNAc:undecaprenyl-phosphate GlcNAc-1-phosphate transferase